jgi:ubiquinone/menaquinone biosynthesis C-methylase UbiE
MSYFGALFYDKFMLPAEEGCLRDWRRELLAGVRGDVLEIGAGTGASLECYPDSVNRLVLSEPDRHMRRQIIQKTRSCNLPCKQNITVNGDTAEIISSENEAFDFVVTSLVCCSVRSLENALIEIRRVLKSGGQLVFLEHVAAAEGTRRRRWQNLLNPFWQRLAGNCHLNRLTESAILTAGFQIQEIRRESMRKAMPLVRPTIRGIAVKRDTPGA